MVSKGDGFVPLAAAAEMMPGSKVMVGPGGVAMIVYAGGCIVRVGSGLWVVQDAAPCDKGTTELDFTGRMNEGLLNREPPPPPPRPALRSEEHTSELQSLRHLVCRLLLEKKNKKNKTQKVTAHNSMT